MNEVYLRPVNEEDIRYIHKWWNDFDNFGATGIEKKISFEIILSRYKNRYSSEPYEEWFSICVKKIDRPVGNLIVAPKHPKENLLSIGSIIIDKKYRRYGYGFKAIKRLEEWSKKYYPSLILSLGVFEDFPAAKLFWESCGFKITEIVETDYVYQGKKQKAFKFEKRLD